MAYAVEYNGLAGRCWSTSESDRRTCVPTIACPRPWLSEPISHLNLENVQSQIYPANQFYILEN